jgi:hypothetical protein
MNVYIVCNPFFGVLCFVLCVCICGIQDVLYMPVVQQVCAVLWIRVGFMYTCELGVCMCVYIGVTCVHVYVFFILLMCVCVYVCSCIRLSIYCSTRARIATQHIRKPRCS